MTNQVRAAHDDRRSDHPRPILGQEHEAEIECAGEFFGQPIGLPGTAVVVGEDALENQRETEGEQQTVEVVELVQPRQHRALDDDAGDADDERRDEQRPPVPDARDYSSRKPCAERPEHVLRAVREIDDVEQAENDRQAERQHGVERAVDQPDQQLPEQGLGRYAEDFGHRSAVSRESLATSRHPRCHHARRDPRFAGMTPHRRPAQRNPSRATGPRFRGDDAALPIAATLRVLLSDIRVTS